MFSFNFQGSGWLQNYLLYRLKTPFSWDKRYEKLKNCNSILENLDKCLYSVTKENGIIYGCPIISPYIKKLAYKLKFPPKKGGTILLFLETLFSITIFEKKILLENYNNIDSANYEKDFLKIIFLVIDYHLPRSYYRIPKSIENLELLKNNETMKRALKKLETVFLNYITLKGYSSLGNRQNNFAFLQLYFFLLWNRENSKRIISSPIPFHKIDSKLREEMIFMFAALIWADDFVEDSENNVIQKYLEQTCLTERKQIELLKLIRKPIKMENINCSFKSLITNNFIVEQLILLSLIDNQKAWQERKLIMNISLLLGISEEKLDQLFYSVGEFFTLHFNRLEFLKNNHIIQQIQDYMNDMVVSLVKKNLDSIMNEIIETKELSKLLIKSTSKKLTIQEKQKVNEQLLDIARSIPALAIFALPGGGVLLPVIMKALPFKILPSSFHLNPENHQILEK